jgi:hypothetical protein
VIEPGQRLGQCLAVAAHEHGQGSVLDGGHGDPPSGERSSLKRYSEANTVIDNYRKGVDRSTVARFGGRDSFSYSGLGSGVDG